MKLLISEFSYRIIETSSRFINTDIGELRPVPNYIIWLMVYLCVSVLLQGIADVVLKILSLVGVLPTMPLRTDFLFLTAISVLMGYRTLSAMLQKKFDVTRNSIELGILVEIALIVGDSLFMREHLDSTANVVAMRLPFVLLTLINIVILLYTYHELQCRNWLQRTRRYGDQLFKSNIRIL